MKEYQIGYVIFTLMMIRILENDLNKAIQLDADARNFFLEQVSEYLMEIAPEEFHNPGGM